MTTSGDLPIGAIQFRFYLSGQIIRQEITEVSSAQHLADLGAQHSLWMVQQAEPTDGLWMVEAELLSNPTDPNRFLRFGTDDGGMQRPHPLRG